MRTVEEWLGKDNVLGINIWKNKYQFENETFEEWLDRVSDGNEDIKDMILNKRFLFGGRILANRGLDKLGKKVTYSNCYVLSVDDSIESIYKTCSDLARTFSYGGGVGIDISKLRPVNSYVNNTARKTSGACSFMDTFSQVTETIGQNGRRGALMLSMDCTHPEIIDFINIKTDLNRVTKANISVRITDDFMKAVKNDEDWELYFKTEHEEIKKTVKAKDIFKLLCKNNWDYAEPGILFWDRIKNYNILSEDENFEYAGVNPCAEEPLPDGGSCLLGALNLSAYVENKEFNFDLFKEDICKAVKGLNEVLDQGLPLHPLAIQRETVRDYRQIGLGVMGIADMLIKMGIKYDSDEALELCDTIGYTLADTALKSSALLAKERGAFVKCNPAQILETPFIQENANPNTKELIKQYGLINSQLLTIAPTGTLSTMLGISGGVEPIFANSYTRKTESLHGEDIYYKVYTPIVEQYMKVNNLTDESELPEYFVTAKDIVPIDRIKMQEAFQYHIDASISSTINLPNEATIEDVEEIYIKAWLHGLKGVTIYRAGCAREGILVEEPNKKEDKPDKLVYKATSNKMPRGYVVDTSDDLVGYKRKLNTGCGSIHMEVYADELTGELQETFINIGSSGGCERNYQFISRLISTALRGGIPIEVIIDQAKSIRPCTAYVSRTKTKGDTSPGTSCPYAIGLALQDLYNKTKDSYAEDELEVIETNPVKQIKSVKVNDKSICPECGSTLQNSGGCVICMGDETHPGCGWSKCD